MRRRDLLPLALLGGIAAFIVVQGREMGRERARRPPTRTGVEPQGRVRARAGPEANGAGRTGQAGDSTSVSAATAPAPGDQATIELRPSGIPAPLRDDAVIRTQISENESGTYILDILRQRQQMLMRWPDRRIEGLRVWIERESSIPDWNAGYPVVAEHAFDEWHEAGFPIRFDFVKDPVGADISIRWVRELEGRHIGMTSISRDQSGWLVSAEISIAIHDSAGAALSPDLVAGVLRHEVGHALGLGHSGSTADVMYPESTTPTISDADRATLHLIYALPPGLVR